jgi:hypothetical protein
MRRAPQRRHRDTCDYATEVTNAIGSTIEGSSFPGLLTRVEIGHIRIGSRRMASSIAFLKNLIASWNVARWAQPESLFDVGDCFVATSKGPFGAAHRQE